MTVFSQSLSERLALAEIADLWGGEVGAPAAEIRRALAENAIHGAFEFRAPKELRRHSPNAHIGLSLSGGRRLEHMVLNEITMTKKAQHTNEHGEEIQDSPQTNDTEFGVFLGTPRWPAAVLDEIAGSVFVDREAFLHWGRLGNSLYLGSDRVPSFPSFWGNPAEGQPMDWLNGAVGVPPAEHGLPLGEALKRYSDFHLWADYESRLDATEREILDSARFAAPMGSDPNFSDARAAWIERTLKLLGDLEQQFIEHVRAHRLFLWGYVAPTTLESKSVPVPPDKLRHVQYNFDTNVLDIGSVRLVDVLVYPKRAQPHPSKATAAQETPAAPKKPGRRREFDWDQFHREIIRVTFKRGLPGLDVDEETWSRQADLVRHMLEWCQTHWPKEPGESTVEEKISAIYQYIGKAQ